MYIIWNVYIAYYLAIEFSLSLEEINYSEKI